MSDTEKTTIESPGPDDSAPLVFVRWVDSFGSSSEWSETEGLEAKSHVCHSVGWLKAESDDSIVVIPHISPANSEIGSDEHGCGDMTIPKRAIIEQIEILLPNVKLNRPL